MADLGEITNAVVIGPLITKDPANMISWAHRLAGVAQEPDETPSPGRRIVAIDEVTLEYIGSTVSEPDGTFEMSHLADRSGKPNKISLIIFDDDATSPHHKAEIVSGVTQVT